MTKQVTYSGIVFLHQEESYEVRKNQAGKIQYYTKVDTGESGMSVNGLANACGVAHPSLLEFLNSTFLEVVGKTVKNSSNRLNNNKNEVVGKIDLYLIESDDLHVIRDIYCERIIYYYAFESRYKKTKARELYQALAQNGLRQFIHSKTGYQKIQAQQHDNSLELSIEEQLRRENEGLKLQLVQHQEELAEKNEIIRKFKHRPKDEKTYQAYLQGVMGGDRELYLSGPYPGRVDLVTNKMVVEVKRVENFEMAFGQLLRYRAKLKGSEHEGKAYVIYLFGNVSADEHHVLDSMAAMANFQLMIEQNIKDYMDEDEVNPKPNLRVVVSNDVG